MSGGWIGSDPNESGPALPVSGTVNFPKPTPAAAPAAPDPNQPAGNNPWHVEGPPVSIEEAQSPWHVEGGPVPLAQAITRPHHDPAKPVLDNTVGLFTKARDVMFGHEPEGPDDPDQRHVAGILPSVSEGFHEFRGDNGPSWTAIGAALPKQLEAHVENIAGGAQQGYGGSQTRTAERTVAALNVLPQVAARTPGQGEAQMEAMAADPTVQKTARAIGIDPKELAAQWAQYSWMKPEQQQREMLAAQQEMARGQVNDVAGQSKRDAAWATERVWQPRDLLNPDAKLNPWTLKGLAFNSAVALPDMLAIAGASIAGGAAGGPVGAATAGGAVSAAIMAPQQYGHARDVTDGQIQQMRTSAQQAQEQGNERSAAALSAQADELGKNADRIASTYAMLSSIAGVAGSLPAGQVLARTPAGKAILDRIVGSALAPTFGGRVAGAMLANGAGASVQAALQHGIDTGILHETTPLKDAIGDILQAGLIGVTTMFPLAYGHAAIDRMVANARAPAQNEAAAAELGAQAAAYRADYNRQRQEFEANQARSQADAEARARQQQRQNQPGRTKAERNFDTATAGGTDFSDLDEALSKAQAGKQQQGQPGAQPGAQAPPGGEETPRQQGFKAKQESAFKAAAGATQRSDVTMEERDGEHHIVVAGKSVASFASKANAQATLAQARKLVGTAPPAVESAQSTRPAADQGQTAPSRTDTAPSKEGAGEEAVAATGAPTTHPVTGLPDDAAYQAAEKKPVQLVVHPTDLGFLREHGEDPNQLLKAIASAAPEAYHLKGDQFVLQAATHEEAQERLAELRGALRDHEFGYRMPGGDLQYAQGVDLDHGIGATLEEARKGLQPKASAHAEADAAGRETGVGGTEKPAASASTESVKPARAGKKKKPPTLIERVQERAEELRALGEKAGWIDPGGKLIRGHGTAHTSGDLGYGLGGGEVIGRTKPTPKETWFHWIQTNAKLPGNLSGNATRKAIERAIKGRVLGVAQERHLEALLQIAEVKRRIGADFDLMPLDELHDHLERLNEVAKGMGAGGSVGEELKLYGGKMPSTDKGVVRKGGGQPDLFGNRSDIANEIARVKAAIAKKEAAAPPPESGATPDLFNSGSKQTDIEDKGVKEPRGTTRDLIVQHNLTAENLMHAHRMGGIAVPSLAITRVGHPMTNFGEITLLGDRDMANPKGSKGTKVFGADLYSPRYPTVSYHFDKAGMKRLNDSLGAGLKYPLDSSDTQDFDNFRQHPAVVRHFLASRDLPVADDERTNLQTMREAGLRDELEEHARKLFMDAGPKERIFQGFDYNGNRRYVAHTLERAVAMIKKNLRGGEASANLYGAGQLRAKFTPQFRSIEQIKRESGRLVSKEDFDRIKEEVNDELLGLADRLAPLHPHSRERGGFGFVDTVIAAIEDSTTKGIGPAFKEYGFHELSDADRNAVYEYVSKLRNLPTEYFEGKILRGVGLGEFKHAVVPEGTRQEVLDTLARHGVPVTTYAKGDPEARIKAIQQAAHGMHEGVFEPAAGEDSVKEKRRAYNDKQLTLDFGNGPEKVTTKFETRPDATPAELAIGKAFLENVLSYRDRGAGARVLGNHIAREFIDRGYVKLTGQHVPDRHALALLAQVYRHPKVETFRIIFTKNNVVVDQRGYSTRMPAGISFTDEMPLQKEIEAWRKVMAETGADGYWMLHNHPSGNPRPSTGIFADQGITIRVAHELPGFQGHVVVDHNAYGHLDARGDITVHQGNFGGYIPGKNPTLDHPLLGQEITTTTALAKLAAHAQRVIEATGGLNKHTAIIIATDRRDRVAVITEMPMAMLESDRSWKDRDIEGKLAGRNSWQGRVARIRRIKAAGGAGGRVFAIVHDPMRLLSAYQDGSFDDVIAFKSTAPTLADRYRQYGTAIGELERERTGVREERTEYGKPFYSALSKAVLDAKRDKGTGAEWLGTLRNMPGVKQEELDWTGLDKWLAGRGRVSRQEVYDYMRAHEIEVGEVMHGADVNHEKAYARLRELGYEMHGGEGERRLTGPNGRELSGDEISHEANEIYERIIDGVDDDTKFGKYSLNGGQHYRELLLTLPTASKEWNVVRHPTIPGKWTLQRPTGEYFDKDEANARGHATSGAWDSYAMAQRHGLTTYSSDAAQQFAASHWDTPNVLAHVRFDERTDADGKRTLHIAEIQSDWHQKGRRLGYKGEGRGLIDGHDHVYWAKQAIDLAGVPSRRAEWHQAIANRDATEPNVHAVPNAPFKTTWPELALKRMIRFAAEHGYERLSWDTGETNAKRYSLEKHINAVAWNGTDLKAWDKKGKAVYSQTGIHAEDLPQLIGKELAERLIAAPDTSENSRIKTLEGLDLHVGGEGMRGFYDQTLPTVANRVIKKLGGRVKPSAVRTDGLPPNIVAKSAQVPDHPANKRKPTPAHSIDITPEIAGMAMRGQALFEPQRTPYGSELSEEPFYSALSRAVESAKRDKGTGPEWLATLKNMPGVKREELDWTGLEDWLAGRGRVSRAEVADYMRAHEIHVGEVMRGDPTNPAAAQKLRSLGYEVQLDHDDVSLIRIADGEDVTDETVSEELPDEVLNAWRELQYEVPEEPKYQTYSLPGGRDYRELLLTLPHAERANVHALRDTLHEIASLPGNAGYYKGEGRTEAWDRNMREFQELGGKPIEPEYSGPHWNQANVLAHIRFDERTDADGKRTLHMAEVQSDWHQKGREHGYAGGAHITKSELNEARRHAGAAILKERSLGFDTPEQALSAINTHPDWEDRWHIEDTEGLNAVRRYAALVAKWRAQKNPNLAPDAPFKTTWPELALKRMIRFAAEHGYDRLSWDTGDTNADRYSLDKHISELHVGRNNDGTYSIGARTTEGMRDLAHSEPESKLPDIVGKEMAEKIVANKESLQSYEGLDLKVGGNGMREFYDKILPAAATKLVKKWGGKVGRTVLPDVRDRQYEQPLQVAAHSIDITPEVASHVMRGQALFEPQKPYGPARPVLDEEPPEPHQTQLALNGLGGGDWGGFRKILSPTSMDVFSKDTAALGRAALGELAQATHQALKQLDVFSKQFDLLPIQDRLDFMHAMETGAKQPKPELQKAADTIRKMLDEWRDRVIGLDVGALSNWIENYFPHIWADPDNAKRVLGAIAGRRPLRGPASFLKQRVIPTIKEGMDLGLKPLSTNPLILTLLKLREMQRFVTGTKLMQQLKAAKLAVFAPANKPIPPDFRPIEDAVGRVLQWSEDEGGFVIRGKYVMPENAARVINNHLSASALQGFTATDVVRRATSVVSSLQLGFSAFHLGFTTLDAVISKNALAIERMLRGEPLRAAQALLEGVTGPGAAVMNLARGMALMRAYSNPAGATPLMQAVVKGLVSAGGRVKMDRYFQAAQNVSPFSGVGFRSLAHEIRAALQLPHGKVAELTKAMTSFIPQYSLRLWRDLQDIGRTMPAWEVPFEVGGRLVHASSALIMEHIVPLQKLGVFSDLAHDFLRTHPDATPEDTVKAMQSIWDSVDNRLGEMVYDNLFWHRTFKDIMHMSVRAVGWNLGTIREIGGAPTDVVRLLEALRKGNVGLGKGGKPTDPFLRRFADQVGHRIPYVLAMTGTTMVLGAMLQYLLTGKGPEETKDYFFPRTGRLTKYGTPERISLPSYVKDIYEYSKHPGQTVINKANPLIGMMASIYQNRDFYGDAIRNPDAPWYEQLKESAQYAAREMLPFSIQGAKQFAGATDDGARGAALTVAPFVGLTPAPAMVTSPEMIQRFEHSAEQQAYIKGLNRQLRAAEEKKDEAEAHRLREELRQERANARRTQHEIKQERARGRSAKAHEISDLLQGKGLHQAADAAEGHGYPALAALLRSLPEKQRPRVARALEDFA